MAARPATSYRRSVTWPDMLADFIESRRTQSFAWGEQDCMTFACDCVATLIGVDPIADKRGTWSTEEQAEAITDAEGGFEVMMATRMQAANLPECDPRFAARGDVALIRLGNQLTAGIVTGGRVAATGPDRLVFVSPRLIRRAWVV